MTFHAVPQVFHNISKFLSDFRIIISVYHHMVEHIETYFPFHNLTFFKVERYQKVNRPIFMASHFCVARRSK